MKLPNFKNKLYVNGMWSLMGNLLPKAAIFLTSIFLARILNVEKFGDLGIVRSTINMFTVFATVGLGLTATKYISEYFNQNIKDLKKTAEIISLSNFFSLSFGLIVTLLVVVFSDSISENIIKKPELQNDVIIGALMLLFNSLNASQIGILAGFQKYKSIAINSLVSILISFPIQILGAYYYEIEGALLGFSVNFVVLYILNKIVISRFLKQNGIKVVFFQFKNQLSIFYRFTLPSSFSGLMVTPITWFITVLLIRSENGSFNLGIFEAANQIKMVIIFIPLALSNVLLPILMENKNSNKLNEIINKNLMLNFIISSLICIVICFLSNFVMGLFGKEFSRFSSTLIYLSISTVFMAVNNVIGQIIASRDKMWVGFVFNLCWGIVLVFLSYIFIYKYNFGPDSLALAYLFAYLLHTIWQFIYLKVSHEKYNLTT